MELLQLQYFKTIAECQHITKAANKLMISQPSLSNTLSRIEAELGVQLFDRQGRNIVLNNYGKIVLDHANNILRELDNMRTEIDVMQQRQNNVISIASTDSIYMREWLPAFIRANSDLTIHHQVSSAEKIEAALLDGTIDFGISSALCETPSFGHHTLWEDEYIVMTPHPNPLQSSQPLDFSEFRNMPFVALPSLDYRSRSIDILSKASGITPNIIFEGERDLLERVMLPLQASIVILRSTIQEDSALDKCTPYCDITRLSNPEAHISVTLLWDANRSRTAAAQRLLDYVKANDISAWNLYSPIVADSDAPDNQTD